MTAGQLSATDHTVDPATMQRIVIVGYGVAGLTAGDALRGAGFDGELIIVGEEPSAPYSRPALSKALLSDSSGAEPDLSVLTLPAPVHGGTETLGQRAVGVCPAERILLLEDGTTLAWDGLVIATGARPRRFTDSPHEFTLRTLPEALALRSRFASRPHMTVIGAGPLGMEVASSARAVGCEVTVVHPGTPMVRQLGAELGELCARAAVDHGVRLVDDVAVAVDHVAAGGPEGADAGDDVLTVTLGSGQRLATDLLITAIGDRPNDEWLAGSGLLRHGRLVVDERGLVLGEATPGGPGTPRAGDGRIVATGDVAWLDAATGPARVPLWTHAIDHARAAAASLLHGSAAATFVPRPYFWTEQFGLHVRVSGPVPAGVVQVVDGDLADGGALLRWDGPDGAGSPGTAAAVNYRIPIPRLRRMAAAAPAAARPRGPACPCPSWAGQSRTRYTARGPRSTTSMPDAAHAVGPSTARRGTNDGSAPAGPKRAHALGSSPIVNREAYRTPSSPAWSNAFAQTCVMS